MPRNGEEGKKVWNDGGAGGKVGETAGKWKWRKSKIPVPITTEWKRKGENLAERKSPCKVAKR